MTKPVFDDEFKQGVVDYANQHPEESKVSIAKSFGIADSTIHKWIKDANKNGNKIETFKLDKNLRKLKYIILIVFVIILPLFLVDILGQGSPYFCKLISPIGMLGLWKLFIQLLAQFQYSGID